MGDQLQIDVLTPDTRLAVDFLKEKKLFSSTCLIGSKKHRTMSIQGTEYEVCEITNENVLKHLYLSERPEQVYDNLDKAIQENKDLIMQLEYLVRQVSVEETQFNLNLISSYAEREQRCERLQCTLFLYFDRHTPLSCIAAATEGRSVIVCTVDAAPLVALLSTLLGQSGCCRTGYIITNDLKLAPWVFDLESKELIYKKHVSEFASGCLAVVTETADVDAALDAVLSSFVQNPWKIQKVLVQENVYDSFKKALHWKWERQIRTNENASKVHREMLSKCTAVYELNDKTFLFDYADTEESQELQRVTLVEAYRTNQELSLLLKHNSSFGLTVWCNNVCVANKIAYEARASVVWINDYGYFRGCSNVFFNKIWVCTLSDLAVDECPVSKRWHGLDKKERLQLIATELKNRINIPLYDFFYTFITSGAGSTTDHNQVTVDSVGQCVMINTPRSRITMAETDAARFAKALTLVVEGSSVIISHLFCNQIFRPNNTVILGNSPLYNCKAVYTRFS